MNPRTFTIICALSVAGSPSLAQSGGGGAGGGGASSGASSAASGASGTSLSSASTAGGTSSSTPIPGTTNGSTMSNALQTAPGTPNTQPNTYKALNRGSSADQMGTIGGSGNSGGNSIGPGNALSWHPARTRRYSPRTGERRDTIKCCTALPAAQSLTIGSSLRRCFEGMT
jgi:hypothetical protein